MCVAHLTFFRRYALMAGVKNSMPSKPGADMTQVLAVDHRLLPIIGPASRPVFCAARGFEYWNLAVPIIGFLWSLDVGAWNSFSQPSDPIYPIRIKLLTGQN
jgi:hypothetical protein